MKYLAVLILLFATSVSAQYERDSAVIIRTYAELQSLNPYKSLDADAAYVQAEIFETLTSNDPKTLALVPGLASLPVISNDKLTYRYMLLANTRWSDGKKLTSDDVVFSFKSAMNPKLINGGPLRNYLLDIREISKINEQEFEIKLSKPNPWHAQTLGSYVVILPKHIWDPNGISDRISWSAVHDENSAHEGLQELAFAMESQEASLSKKMLIGSGPYKLQLATPTSEIVLERDESYWGRGMRGKEAYPKHLVFRPIYDDNAAARFLMAGEIDVLGSMRTDVYDQIDLSIHKHLAKASAPYNNFSFIALNNDEPMFKDKLTRQGLAASIDRASIHKAIMKSEGGLVEGPVAYMQTNFDKSVRQQTFDVTRAKKLLKDTGWTDSNNDGVLDKTIDGHFTDLSFTLRINSGNSLRQQVAEMVVKQLAAIVRRWRSKRSTGVHSLRQHAREITTQHTRPGRVMRQRTISISFGIPLRLRIRAATSIATVVRRRISSWSRSDRRSTRKSASG